ncbi:transcription initiation factor TFIID subunit 8 [Malania oleifera]|uniref:transcription initiation factor TFIID subunit 8 n=1 Tax=Malania oleifera TaxID=397392 RepID=UPI0025AEA53A|nr:transcription initiation factor TFIID subunit 8 [Malania oleifera]
MTAKSRISKTITSQEALETHSPSEFAAAITRVAVAQICRAAGFSASQFSALQTLTRIAALYLQALAGSAASRATTCGRTQTNLFDVVHAFEFLDSVRGFPGASDADQLLLSSKTLKSIIRFVNSVEKIPFAKPIPRRDDFRTTYSTSTSISPSQNWNKLEINSRRLQSHIPNWLPAFPDPKNKIAEKERCDYEVSCTPCSAEKSPRKVSIRVLDDEKRELPAKRARVRFKMGVGGAAGMGVGVGGSVDRRNGVCRGGKRVSWHCAVDDDDQQKKMVN